MGTYEWLGLIFVLIAGFWKLCDKLSKIEVALAGKVSFGQCEKMQKECPCQEKVEKLEELVEKLHPHKENER